jgi:hypothetical protein
MSTSHLKGRRNGKRSKREREERRRIPSLSWSELHAYFNPSRYIFVATRSLFARDCGRRALIKPTRSCVSRPNQSGPSHSNLFRSVRHMIMTRGLNNGSSVSLSRPPASKVPRSAMSTPGNSSITNCKTLLRCARSIFILAS